MTDWLAPSGFARRDVFRLAGAAALAGSRPASAAPVGRVAVEGEVPPALAQAIAEIGAFAERQIDTYALPGLAVALVVPGAAPIVLKAGFADRERQLPFRPDHLFQIGSIGKSFTALCIYRLAMAGRVRLGDDVRALFPEVRISSAAAVTVQQLLNHSSGLPNAAPLWPRGGDNALWTGFTPGTAWSYSNTGYVLLSELIQRIERRPFRECLQQQILSPLGMKRSRGSLASVDRGRYPNGYGPAISSRVYGGEGYPVGGPLAIAPWVDLDTGAGCVAATLGDMATYMTYLLAAAAGRGEPLLDEPHARLFFQPTIAAPALGADARYANGLAIVRADGRDMLHHTGGTLSFGSAMDLDPATGTGAFASANVGSVPYRPKDLTAFACACLRRALAGEPPSAPPIAPAAKASFDIEGAYRAPDGRTLDVSTQSGRFAAFLDGAAIDLEPLGDDAFMASDPTALEHPLVFRKPGQAWLGDIPFVRSGHLLPAGWPADPAPELARLRGYYASDDPWRGSFRITSQGETLFLDGVTPLAPISPTFFHLGGPESPERITFEAFVDGRPQRAVLSGADHLRRNL